MQEDRARDGIQGYSQVGTGPVAARAKAPESQKHSDKSLTNLTICLRIGVSGKLNIDDSLTPVSDRSLNNGLFHKDTTTSAQDRNMQNPKIAPSELLVSSHAAEQLNSGAELSTLSIGKRPIKLDTSRIDDDSDLFKAFELSKQTVIKSRYELEPEEAL